MTEWFEKWFGEEYLALYPHRDEREAATAVGLVESNLGGIKVDRALDLACGAGRHSRLLSERWWTAGFDLSAPLLERAKAADPDGFYVRGDMRALPFVDHGFDLVVNLFTSFGYFDNDAQHLRVLAEVARVTRRGGKFVLDFLNSDHVRSSLVPKESSNIGGRAVEVRREISPDDRFVVKTIAAGGETGDQTFVERVRLFDRLDLETMLEESGFGVEQVLGDYAGGAHSTRSPRTIMFAIRE
ncbi:MAG: class I SAM-dependent methyltransferase [Gemmatimonadaceae bacterium]